MKLAKHSERTQTQRTDVEWIDGVPYCQTCNHYVSRDDTCGPECMQTELANVLKYIRAQRNLSTRFNTDYEGSVYDALGEIIDELSTGEHR